MNLLAHLSFLATLFAAADGPARTAFEAARQATEDATLLHRAGVPTDGPGLVAFLRRQILTEADRQAVAERVRRLASPTFKVRDRAAAELTRSGPAVLPLLRQAPKGDQLEAQRRLQRCIETLEKIPWNKVGTAAARRLQALRPPEACAALLAYVPFGGEDAEEETLAALLALGAPGGKPDPVLDAALRDAEPTRRAAAALVLAQKGDAKQREAVRAVLRSDLYLSVRLRAVEGLLEAGDPAPIPVLIAILADGNDDLSHRAYDLLRSTAGDKAPALPPGGDPESRRKGHEAWLAWWQATGGKLDLSRTDLAQLRVNPARVARQVAERFVRAVLVAPNLAEFTKTTDVPFTVQGEKTLKTRAELDELFRKLLEGAPPGAAMFMKMPITQLMRLDEYEKTRPAKDDQGRAFLRGLRGPTVFVAILELSNKEGDNVGRIPLLVRVRGINARVIAVGRER